MGEKREQGTFTLEKPSESLGDGENIVPMAHRLPDPFSELTTTIDLSKDGGATYPVTLVSIGDVTTNAAWTQVTSTVTNPGMLRLRVRASDGPAAGDLVEGGLDDVLIWIPE